MFTVRRLLIFALLIHKPDAAQAILATVVADAKLTPNFFFPTRSFVISVDEANS